MHWPFAKFVGCGNDFILFDNRVKTFPLQQADLIKNLCHRQKGIGADGVILLEDSEKAGFRMRIFNSDGSEAEMCGNGIRCLFQFLHFLGFQEPSYQIETKERVLKVSKNGSDVAVEMGDPSHVKWDLDLYVENQKYKGHFLNTGVPHFVLFLPEIQSFNLNKIGPLIRHHSTFSPHGTNVNIVQCSTAQSLSIRTFERGVEAETLACGTGVTAAALAAAHQFSMKSPIQVTTQSKETLHIDFHLSNGSFSNVIMTGPATFCFEGSIDLKSYFFD